MKHCDETTNGDRYANLLIFLQFKNFLTKQVNEERVQGYFACSRNFERNCTSRIQVNIQRLNKPQT